MQGNLHEIDVRSILQLIELGQRTGQLLIEVPNLYSSNKADTDDAGETDDTGKYQQKYWLVFFLNGRIIYCQAGENLSRIDDYLHHHRIETNFDKQQLTGLGKHNPSEYEYLWLLLEENLISPKIAENIIYRLICETLFDLFNLQEGYFIFLGDSAIAPQLTSWEISPLVTQITQQLQGWNQLYPYIHSPYQLLVLADRVHLNSSLPEATITKLKQWADGKTTLRQLGRYLNRDILTVAKVIYPHVQQGWLKLTSPQTNQNIQITQGKNKAKILCINDTKSTCETIESILQAQGYEAMGYTLPEVIALSQPLEALSLIVQLQPNLILCDIITPELNDYEICAMLRQSQVFRYIPMIMLSSKDKFIDRIRTRMAGVTDYLIKPFNNDELLMLVKKYLRG
ncbi:response regulator [Nostoc sp. MS1]|uniref:response regulator n=1 Tax=Nostoc sp. MS1 TaxID=2764711 RepID=UPI001CC5ED51|nr:response regulator [Nostoc sp. MS1]BCL37091.1 transcriptional regulator [Nostoc sp. MS1]